MFNEIDSDVQSRKELFWCVGFNLYKSIPSKYQLPFHETFDDYPYISLIFWNIYISLIVTLFKYVVNQMMILITDIEETWLFQSWKGQRHISGE